MIVEGFDPFNKRRLEFVDSSNTNGDNKCENLLYYVSNDNHLADSLRAHGYDVIILNFQYGTGNLFDIAMVVVEAIQTINNIKVEDNELVIIGPSMGGVLSRYALTYMEHNGMEHKTKLFLSFDAPHQGANVCLGMQNIANFALNSTYPLNFAVHEAVQKLRNGLLDAPATKQLVRYHHSATSGHHANPSPDHTLFYDAMQQLNPANNGYPEKPRNIAISCGSGHGINANDLSPGENLFTYYTQTPRIPYVGAFRLYLRYNALPNHTSKVISQGYIAYSAWLFPLPPTPFIPFNIHSKTINNTDPLDQVPAGTQTFHSMVNNMIAHFPNTNIPTGIILKNDQQVDAFIPVISALDLNTTNWNYSMLTSSFSHWVGTNDYYFSNHNFTPFDEVYINNWNNSHVIGSITQDPLSGIWAKNEISPYYLKLQNHTVYYDTRYEAKRTINTGRDVTNQINTGDFKLNSNIYILSL